MLLDYFVRGGPVMWPILAVSVLALAVILDRIAWMARTRGDGAALRIEVLASLDAGKPDLARARCEGSPLPVAAVLRAGLSAWDAETLEVERRLEQAAADELERAERRLPLLSSLVAVLPMLGFLGTILGLIDAFSAWQRAGAAVRIEELAGGISAAMITTAAGLVTSIPYFLAYNGLAARVAGLARSLNGAASELAARHRSCETSKPRLSVASGEAP